MVSSTFTDLEEHRAELIEIIDRYGLKPIVMEHDSAKPDADVIDSSLAMVKDASAYVGIIAKKYGQTPTCVERNPNGVSITELEFDEAQRLQRPILLFIMGAKHLVLESQIEPKAAKKKKLNAFRERAKRMGPDSEVHRVYATFESLEEFKEKAAQSVAELRRYFDEQDKKVTDVAEHQAEQKPAKP